MSWCMIAAAMLAALWLIPVHLEVYVLYAGRLQVIPHVSIFGFRLPFRRRKRSTAQGKKPPRSGSVLMAVFRRLIRHRGLISRYLHLEKLQVRALVSRPSAAATALLTGTISGCFALLPHAWLERADLSILPDFFTGRSRAQGTCIIWARLGIMMLSAATILISIMREEHRMRRNERPLRP